VAEEISFIGGSQNCCVCFIDIVDSTRITTVEILDSEKIKIYYSVFINTMAAIVRNFDGTIIKNTGDSLIYYFPKTMGHVSDGNVTNLKSVFECGLTMLAVHPIMNIKLKEKGLPDLSYNNMNGFQLCRKLREIDKRIKICFLTATELLYYRDKESDIIDDLGADCFVPKPVNTIDLVNRLKVILS
jgi:CheY-like chemotaxis protein